MIVSKEKYSSIVSLLVFSTVFGGIGGGFQISRLLALFFFPLLCSAFSDVSDDSIVKVKNVFLFWGMYNIVSLIWTSDLVQGLKEVCYYPVNFIFFLELAVFCRKCDNPLRTISVAGNMALALSLAVAFWEITTGNHLPCSKYDAAIPINFGDGNVIIHNFASVTFGNYNCYVVYLGTCFPFALYSFLCLGKKMQTLSFILILLSVYVILYNGSRGGVLSFSVFFAVFVILAYRKLNYVYMPLVFVLLVFIFLALFWKELSLFFMKRLEKGLNDPGRWEIWDRSLQVFASSYGFGTGVGSVIASMTKISRFGEVLICHNSFLEILVQFGVIIFIWCILFFVKIIRRLRWNEDMESKIVVICSLCSIPSLSIIDSGCMLSPFIWAFLASLYIFSTDFFWRNTCQPNEEI